MARTQFVERHM